MQCKDCAHFGDELCMAPVPFIVETASLEVCGDNNATDCALFKAANEIEEQEWF